VRRALPWIAGFLLLVGTWQVAAASWIHVKGLLAQQLIAAAWESGRSHGAPRRPWPGADLRPLARLTFAQRDVSLYVLDDANPRALAFGPAHVGGTATPGAWGNSVIVAHRDTHFAILRSLAPGDELAVESLSGNRTRYRVREVDIVDRDATGVLDSTDGAQLTLITCYPFDAVMPGTPWRFVVVADRVG
jgi:sortase A